MLNSRGNIALACALSMVAGYVDGIGFIHLGGLFVSFMSGTSTRMGVSVAGGDWYDAAEALGLIARGRSRYRQAWIVLAEAVLLCLAALLNDYGWSPWAIVIIVVAMGLENAVFQVDGGGGLGVTYITGALVKVGQFLAAALTGGDRWAWIPNLLLWAALAIGAVLGGLAYHRFGLAAIWLAAGVAFVLGVILAVGARATRVAERH